MSRRSGSSKQSERSKNERRTQETERESGGDVDVSPDEFSINAGAVEIGLNTEGELSLGIEIPTPAPGVTATGGIVIDTATGEITEISVGAEIGGVTGFEVTLKGCNVITTFFVEVPNTNIRFSYDVISELPNCKIEEDEEELPPEEEEENPFDEPPTPIPELEPEKMYLIHYWYNTVSEQGYIYQFEDGSTQFNITQLTNKIKAGAYNRSETQQNYSGRLYNGSGYGTFSLGYASTTTISSNVQTPSSTTRGGDLIYVWLYPFNEEFSVNNDDKVLMEAPRSYSGVGSTRSGTGVEISSFLNGLQSIFFNDSSSTSGGYTSILKSRNVLKIKILNIAEAVIEKEKSKPKPQPPRKMDKCCRESLKLLEEIHEALGCKELLDRKTKTGGFEVPNRLLAPGGRGEIKHHNYLEILESMIRIQDHLGIHPFQVKIKDLNAAVAGDQGAEFKFLSGTAALEKIVYLLTDTEADGDVQTNMLVRLAFVCTNILTALSTVSRDVETVRDGLGVGFKSKRERVDVPFDVSCGQNDKGFDPKKKKQIDLNEEDSTEALLPYLLRTKNHWIRTTEFDDKDDIKDLLIKILYSLKGRT